MLQINLGRFFFYDPKMGYLRIGKKVRRWGKVL